MWALALMVLAVLLWVYWSGTPSQPPMNSTDKTRLTATTDLATEPAAEPTNVAAAQTMPATAVGQDQDDGGMSEDALTALLALLADAQYSDDPLVEVASLLQQHNHCTHNNIRQSIRDDNQITAVSDQQQATVDALQQRCQKSKERYPFLGDIHQFIPIMHTLPNLPSRSLLGDHYRNRPEGADWSSQMDHLHEQMILGVRERNAQVIMSALDQKQRQNMRANPALAHVLGSQDQAYLNWMSRTALGLISCDFNGGITCRPGGVLMLDKCLQMEQHCKQTFPEWYAEINTPAMHTDVQLTIDFYRQQAASIQP